MLRPLNRAAAQTPIVYPERVVQFGGGNFLRAFVDWMVERLNQQGDFQSSVVIVKPTPGGSYEQFEAQDGLFHVRLHGLEAGALVTTQELITCVSRVVNPYDDLAAFEALARQPEVRFIVSNTTESGLTYAPDDQLTDAPPASFPAKLTLFLYRRFQQFETGHGCIILPCELVERNGERLRDMVLQHADRWGLGNAFAHWLRQENVFCNTLVDRIVPGFPKDVAPVLEQLGYDDRLLVEAEQYHSWVIEGPRWLQDELPLEPTDLNVRIVDDAEPYRTVKVRILNGAHTAMTPIGYLLGLETVGEAMAHPLLGSFVHDLLLDEVIPSFKRDDTSELTTFAADVLNRFRNPFIQHRLLSIALNSVSKFKVRLLPSLQDYVSAKGTLPSRIVFAFASLIRFYKGEWQGAAIPLNDEPAVIAWFREQWEQDIPALVRAVLGNTDLWEQDLNAVDGLSDALTAALIAIETQGIQAALAQQDITS